MLYLFLLLVLYFRQAKYVYYPTREVESTPDDKGMSFEQLDLKITPEVAAAAAFLVELLSGQ